MTEKTSEKLLQDQNLQIGVWLLKYTMLSMIFTKSNYTTNGTNSNFNVVKIILIFW